MVFDHSDCQSSDPCLTLIARRNGLEHARLGLVVGKRVDKRAVTRNRVKRLVRESFRQHQQELVGLDIVVLGRAGASHLDNPALLESLAAHWQRVVKRCATS